MTTAHSARPALARRATLLALLAGSLLTAACGSENPTASAIRSASNRLNLLTAGGASFPLSTADREAGLRKVLSEVQAAGTTGTPAQQAAVALLAAKANNALADIKADAAAQGERRALNHIQVMRTLVRTYVSQSASASVAEQFNPADAITALTTQLGERQTQFAAAKAELDAMQAEVNRLADQAKSLEAQASAKRNEASSIRGQAQGQSQVAQLAAAERAAAVSREASTLSSQASMVAADVSARQPLVTAQQAKLDAKTEEVKRLTDAIAELRTRQTVAAELAASARKDAAASASDFKTRMTELEQLRAGEIATATEAALGAYSAALAAARAVPADASNDDKAALKLSMALAQQGRADTLLIRARGLSELATVLGAAKDAKPDMPGKADIDAAQAKYAAEVATLLTEARAALGEASSSFESLGAAKGVMVSEHADYVSRVMKWLEAGDLAAPKPDMGGGASSGASAAGSTASSTPASSGGSTASTPASSAAEEAVKASVIEMLTAMKNGDAAAAGQHILFKNDQEREVLTAVTSVAGAVVRLDNACKQKFGQNVAEIVGRGGSMGMGDRLDVSPDQIKVTMKSDTEAEVTMPGDTKPVTAKLEGGVWKLPMSDTMATDLGDPVKGLRAAKAIGSVFSGLADDIEAGKITTKEQLKATMMQKMMALQGEMGGGPGGG